MVQLCTMYFCLYRAALLNLLTSRRCKIFNPHPFIFSSLKIFFSIQRSPLDKSNLKLP